VDHVGQQRDAAGHQDDRELDGGRDGEDGERPLDGPDAALRGGDAGIDQAVRVPVAAVVAVRVAVPGAKRLVEAAEAEPVTNLVEHGGAS